ncbi:prolipoprotein diacylglyceryl transferase [Nocardia goodfellowii]|uniref:Uncharacterized protein n=1 Tax=Nocardia goodfellowii TaxID=882446 RepID=A0ABS4QC13_9NOCA|nr:hypothetical protein [Nocardia goodfellowii]MBP2189241.1 hypothetical protein [Nocardia goodfellowii]
MSTKHVHGVQPSDSDTPADDSTYTKPHDAEEDQPMPGDDPDRWSGTHRSDETAESGSTETPQTATSQSATESESTERPDQAQYRHEAETQENLAVQPDHDYDATAESERREPVSAESGTSGSAFAGSDTARPASAESETAGTAYAASESDRPASAESETAGPISAGSDTTKPVSAESDGDASGPLFADDEIDRLRTEWRELQGNFVDNPHDAVTRAQELVSETIDHLTATYAERKQSLADRWTDKADTEDLRHALRGYRAFFNQLLTTGPS